MRTWTPDQYEAVLRTHGFIYVDTDDGTDLWRHHQHEWEAILDRLPHGECSLTTIEFEIYYDTATTPPTVLSMILDGLEKIETDRANRDVDGKDGRT